MLNSLAKHLIKPALGWGRKTGLGMQILHLPLASSWPQTIGGFSPQGAEGKEGGEVWFYLLLLMQYCEFMNRSVQCSLVFGSGETGGDFLSPLVCMCNSSLLWLITWRTRLDCFGFCEIKSFPVLHSFLQPCKLRLFLSSSTVWELKNKDYIAVQLKICFLRCYSPSSALRWWWVLFFFIPGFLLTSSPSAHEPILYAKALGSYTLSYALVLPLDSPVFGHSAFCPTIQGRHFAVPGSHLLLEIVIVCGNAGRDPQL